jgi:hypothetical protein
MRALIAALLLFAVAACSVPAPAPGSDAEIAALAGGIRALSPEVDPDEAARAARISYETSFALARAYKITDPPLIHNSKVNAGTRPRGLCYHWAEDMEARLNREGFRTLDMTRAIANSEKRFFIEHSTAVITAKGAPMAAGIVLDPWRKGGTLFWSPVGDDPRYDWLPREEVLRAKGQIRYVQRTEGSLAPPPLE